MMLKTLSVIAVMMVWLCSSSTALTSAKEPTVTIAVAPVFPRLAAAVNASSRVTVEVKINRQGIVTSKTSLDGHPLFCEAAQNAAQLWRFAPDPEGDEIRTVRLTFVFSLVIDAAEAELTPVFTPPYQVEVKHQVPPHIDVNERPTRPYRRNKKMKGTGQATRDASASPPAGGAAKRAV